MSVTPTDVFTFMGTDEDVSASKEPMMSALIVRTMAEVEADLGRRIQVESLNEAVLMNGHHFEYCENRLYLHGKYRDLFEITTIQVDGESLTGGAYILEAGMILLVDDIWANLFIGASFLSITVSGKLGLVEKESPNNTLPDIAQIIIELVAAKSGLWKTNVQSEGGEITTIRTTINPETKKALKKYKVSLV